MEHNLASIKEIATRFLRLKQTNPDIGAATAKARIVFMAVVWVECSHCLERAQIANCCVAAKRLLSYFYGMSIAAKFAPFEMLARNLLPNAISDLSDGSHDAAHLLRVWRNVQLIASAEGGDLEMLAAATLLHDCVSVPKDSRERAQASRLAAAKASSILTAYGWDVRKTAEVRHAIEAHSFSAQLEPKSTEAKILQDADRLDAIGYIGVARCFYVSARLGRALYDPEDPDASNRALNELDYAIDHFKTKLLRVSSSFKTETGQALAQARHNVVETFMNGLLDEVSRQSGP